METRSTTKPPEEISRTDTQAESFWKSKGLREMTRAEWELLCDGCGKCCLQKLQDEKTGAVDYTNVCCRLFSPATCRCTSYHDRHLRVPTCMILTPPRVEAFDWLPETCAYRLLSKGKDLPYWHHLVSGDPNLIHRLDLSAKGKVISEKHIHPLQISRHIVQWQ
jgi:uncharacterized cysteine cluster protein YcgN (CxxCxxCC family)